MAMLDRTGHTLTEWDTEDAVSVLEAEINFNRHLANGEAAFKETETETVQITKFDPDATTILFSPPLVGG